MNGIAGSTAIRNGSSLMYKSYRDDIAQDYGMPYLFVRYVIDRMAGSYEPMAVLPRFYTVDASSLTCEAYLEKVTGIPFKILLSDFYTAVAAGEASGVYSFPGDRIAAKKASAFPVFSGDSQVHPSPRRHVLMGDTAGRGQRLIAVSQSPGEKGCVCSR